MAPRMDGGLKSAESLRSRSAAGAAARPAAAIRSRQADADFGRWLKSTRILSSSQRPRQLFRGRYVPSPIRSFEIRSSRASGPSTGRSLSKPRSDQVPVLR